MPVITKLKAGTKKPRPGRHSTTKHPKRTMLSVSRWNALKVELMKKAPKKLKPVQVEAWAQAEMMKKYRAKSVSRPR